MLKVHHCLSCNFFYRCVWVLVQNPSISSLQDYFYTMHVHVHFILFVGYSAGDRPLAGYSTSFSSAECLKGFKMVVYVQSQRTGPGKLTCYMCMHEYILWFIIL